MTTTRPLPSRQSVVGLDLVNVFMADVRDGVGVYLSVYLLAVLHWEASRVGLVVAIPGVVAILTQAHAGSFIDGTERKRLLLVWVSLAVAVSCLLVIYLPTFYPVVAAQVLLGLVGPVFQPCVSAVSLGLVGHELMRLRVGRNEGFNHAGNMLAAAIAVVIGIYGSFTGIFWFALVQCAAMMGATLSIRERDIDHSLARAAAAPDQSRGSFFQDSRKLLADRDIACLVAALTLWNVANGFLLPMLGLKLGIDDVRWSAVYLSLCIIVAQAVMIFVAPLAARLARFGRKRALLVAFVMIPIRATLFSLVDDKAALVALQLLDGLGAGFYGVLSIVMMADLSRGTGRFNLLQGLAYASMGVGGATSSVLGGFLIQYLGYDRSFVAFAGIGVLATLFFLVFVREPSEPAH